MTIVKSIKNILAGSGLLSRDREGNEASHELQLAVAVLILRAAYGDKRFSLEEREEAINDLEHEFGMERRDVEVLVEEARELQQFDSWIESFIENIKDSFNIDQRIEILSLVWRIAEADDLVDEVEEDFITSLGLRLGLSTEEGEEAERRAQLSLD